MSPFTITAIKGVSQSDSFACPLRSYVILYNPNNLAGGVNSGPNVSFSFNWADVGLPAGAAATVRDVVSHKDLGTFTGSYTSGADIQPHEARTLKVTPV